MGRLRKSQLLEHVVQSLEEQGLSVSVQGNAHPFDLVATSAEESLRVRVYIWNITHGGGRARADDEYRIQVTGANRFDQSGVDRTLVLGWWEEGGVFAGWDVKKHLGRLGSSPSFQILDGCLRTAARDGIAIQEKGNAEIAVSFVPQFLATYVVGLDDIHGSARSAADLRGLKRTFEDPKALIEQNERSSTPRTVVLARIARKLRAADFSRRVLRAYGNACGMCGVQLKLVDAAHIVPVALDNDDSTSNGLALCALHHRAFDRGLITIDERFNIVINPDRLAQLKHEDRIGGLQQFRKGLRAVLSLPPAARDRPDPRSVAKGNSTRGWRRFERVA